MAASPRVSLPVGCIGAGRMAQGILEGILHKGEITPQNVMVSAPTDRNLEKLKARGCCTSHDNRSVVSNCRVVFLATKPHIIPSVLQEIYPKVTADHLIISMAAGVTLETLEKNLPPGSKVIRMMPNLPCVLQEGAIVFSRGRCAGEVEADVFESLVRTCGLCVEVPQSCIDIHTGVSGSGVAYVYTFAEALADGAVKMGMPSALARQIVAQTLLGAGKMLLQSEEHPASLRADVCTPGGTTIFGLHELEKGGLRAAVMNAVEAATTRAMDMGRK
uniref:Pyrroline-5-carboxylate reductase 3 n=1 Tax=Xenopus laevis TaxID=8355 RepID=P5CR3_XENLA|nr:RecName: Full=Pyrroline-5-carboxylate reductase 3; Short=P5C reductase 3; Short=P5CR 3; AltName: Full=Pyrroline-5-carboxylate reductase-like protein [Xenopus laevis]